MADLSRILGPQVSIMIPSDTEVWNWRNHNNIIEDIIEGFKMQYAYNAYTNTIG